MSRDWTFFLEDIQESCSRVLRYTQGMTFEQFRADDKTYDAVVRNLEIIGEAAKSLPDDVRAMMPDIEWSKATGLRNIVAHAYFGISDEILWDVIQNKILPMKVAVDGFMEKHRKP
jgi:uncharacterized protein with HEPN domain